MTLDQTLMDDLKKAMKAGDRIRVDTLRVLRSQIKNAAIAAGKELSDDDVVAVLNKEAKKRKESIDMYEKGGRQDLADKETMEHDIISGYLPAQFSEAELRAKIAAVIAETGASGMADMGRVMGVLMPAIKGRADGKHAQQIVKELLS
ncbi:GatB/YqeY domain-containing protein [bacterium]|nr:GatB/YqeY domain-containing protein [bacterium]